eukprot:7026050-Alexandrium_andersonii.AAC.1
MLAVGLQALRGLLRGFSGRSVRRRVVRPARRLRPELCVADLLRVALDLQDLHCPRPFGADDGLGEGPK